jgi:DnaJ-class molecular chaperone
MNTETTAPAGVVSSDQLGDIEDDERVECDRCLGKGWNWEEHQVAERKSDIQTFKVDCSKCDGTGHELV